MATLAPSAAKARAMPWPMPDAPPVIRTDLPESFIVSSPWSAPGPARRGQTLHQSLPDAGLSVRGPRRVVTHHGRRLIFFEGSPPLEGLECAAMRERRG